MYLRLKHIKSIFVKCIDKRKDYLEKIFISQKKIKKNLKLNS